MSPKIHRPNDSVRCRTAKEEFAQAGKRERIRHSTTPPRVQIKTLRARPDKPGYWSIELEGHPPFTVADKRLRAIKRFLNVCRYRLGLTFDWMPQEEWEVIIATAIRTACDGGVR
jgi:hypothetical protein